MDSHNWRVKREPLEQPANNQTPTRSVQQRRTNGFGDSPRNTPRGTDLPSSPYSARFSSPQSGSRDSLRKPMNDAHADLAIDEGRRLYVGNLAYEATVKDIESLFQNIAGVQAINMSVDPMTGRNPSYCFVDFESKQLAEKIMEDYHGREFLKRPIRVKPGVKSGSGTGRFDIRKKDKQSPTDENPLAFDRWRRVLDNADERDPGKEKRRLYVGGLPRFQSHAETDSQIRELFEGFSVEFVGKLISPHGDLKDIPGNYYYCFVDLVSPEEAALAAQTLDGKSKWNWNVKVKPSFDASGKLHERKRVFVGGLPEFESQESTDAGIRELFGGFEVTTVSKLFLPKDEAKKSEEGNHCFCFVELKNEEQTDKALIELDYAEKWGGKVRVKPANSSGKSAEKSMAPARGWGPRRD